MREPDLGPDHAIDPGTILEIDPEGRIGNVLRAGAWPPPGAIEGGMTVRDVLAVAEANTGKADRLHALLLDRSAIEVDTTAGDGPPRTIVFRLLPETPAGTRVLVCVDVTENRRRIQEFESASRRLQAILDGTRVGTWEWNVQTGETRFNERWAEIIGYRLDELEPVNIDTWMRFAHEEDLEASKKALEAHFRRETDFYDIDCRMRHRDGHLVWVHDRGRVFSWTDDGAPLMMYGTHQEITGRKEAEDDRVRKAEHARDRERLTGLGLMAGGIAHDFNNILQAIVGYATLLREDLPPEARAERDSVDQIVTSVRRAHDLTDQMLAYSGSGHLAAAPVDLVRVVQAAVARVTSSLPERIRIDVGSESGVPRIEGQEGQLGRVMDNLIRNAIEALPPEGGRVGVGVSVLELGRADLEDEQLAVRAGDELRPGRYLVVTVEDDGSGIEPDTLRRMFDPFFTTKFHGRGLGMASVFGVLTGHGAGLLVRTEPGAGTRMKVLFPSSLFSAARPPEPRAGGADRGPSATAPPVSERREILVVDDEAGVRDVVRASLERAGWRVVTADGGFQALEAFEPDPARWHCVVLDLVMPGLGGAEVLHRMRRLRPDVPVIVMSGYATESLATRFGAELPNEILGKPFTPAELLDLLARCCGPVVETVDGR